MKTLLYTLSLLLLAASGFAQKIAVKGNLVTVDRQPFVRVESDGGLLALGQRTLYVSLPNGERVLVVLEQVLNDPAASTPENPAGSVRYARYLFPTTHTVAELPMSTLGYVRPADIARVLYAARLLHNDRLDPQAVADFTAIYGTPYADRRQALNQALLRPVGY